MKHSEMIDDLLSSAKKELGEGEGFSVNTIKKAKVELESSILDVFKAFEEKTGVEISYINVNRDYPKDYYNTSDKKVREKKYPLKSVDISINF